MKRNAIVLLSGVVLLAAIGIGVGSAVSVASPPSISALWLGDSYSSGWGQPNSDNPCGQSPTAWPLVATKLLEGSDVNLTSSSFESCGGKRTWQVASEIPAHFSPVDLVGFTFGGDDVGFKDILESCIIGDTTPLVSDLLGELISPLLTAGLDAAAPDTCPSDAAVRADIADNLAGRTRGGYQGFLNQIAGQYVVWGGNILVLGYPALIEEESRWDDVDKGFGLCNGLSPQTAYLMRGWAGLLNQEIGEAVVQFNTESATTRHGVTATFVNVQDGGSSSDANPLLFDPAGTNVGHNLCGSNAWIASWRHISDGFHPTVPGTYAEGQLAAQAIEAMSWANLSSSPPVSGGSTPTAASNPPAGNSGNSQPSSGMGSVTLSQGPLYSGSEYWYDISLSGWSPGQSVSITCFDSVDPNGFRSFSATVDSSGSASIGNECRSGTGPDYWVSANGALSNTASWGSAAQTPPPTTTTTSPPPTTTTTTTPTSTPPPGGQPVSAYDNYGTANEPGHAVCRGNPSEASSMPGGVVTQTFVVPAGVANISSAKVQIDPDPTVTAALTVSDGSAMVSASSAAAGDTMFTFPALAVSAGDTVTLTINFSATYGKIITVYDTGDPGGSMTVSNQCPDGAPNFTSTTSGLRAVVYGTS
jgi:hypothetical protein